MNYKVYQGTELKQTVTDKIAVMNGLQPNKTYDFSVEPDNTQTVGGRTRYTHVAYANMKYVATENGTFILSERSTVRFGADNKWVYKTFDAGTYTAANDTFGRDPYSGMGKSAEVVSDFSVGQGSNKTYIGFYTDFIQADSTNPLDYTWNPIQDGDAIRDGTKETISVTTRGIRFNIPKTLTVDSTIMLRYEEYPLGIVPIGNEPSGMFGGGNRQNLSAKVISTANGSSVVEVAGNVIEVGGRNLLIGTSSSEKSYTGDFSTIHGWGWDSYPPGSQPAVNVGSTYTYSIYLTKLTGSFVLGYWGYDSNKNYIKWVSSAVYSSLGKVSWTFTIPSGISYISPHVVSASGGFTCTAKEEKLEQGDIATPYAAFVDGDTFTAQPDGTCALFSEHKALYY